MFRVFSRKVGSCRRYRPARIQGTLRYLVEQRARAAARATGREYVVMEGDRVVTTIVPAGREIVERREV